MRRGEHVGGPDDVDRGVVAGLLHRRLHVGLRGEVEDDVGLDDERLADVVLDEVRGQRSRSSRLPGGEVVDDRHVVAARHQGVDEVRTDEPRAPCHDRPHRAVH